MADRKMLIVVDPQIDFISGTLPVPGATEAMDALADYIQQHASDYALIVVTNDWHPWNHCSFDRNGGPWPTHCVQNSEGAATYYPLLEAIYGSGVENIFLQKGDRSNREEYSIVQNSAAREFFEYTVNNAVVTDEETRYSEIHVCGLAGDVCVLNTVRDLYPLCDERLRVLEKFSPSLDGGKALAELLEKKHIATL